MLSGHWAVVVGVVALSCAMIIIFLGVTVIVVDLVFITDVYFVVSSTEVEVDVVVGFFVVGVPALNVVNVANGAIVDVPTCESPFSMVF